MNIARSTFYYKGKTRSSYQVKAEADLRDRIEAICLEFPRYGYRRVTHELRHKDCHMNHKKVLKTTDSGHRFPRYPNLIKGWSSAA